MPSCFAPLYMTWLMVWMLTLTSSSYAALASWYSSFCISAAAETAYSTDCLSWLFTVPPSLSSLTAHPACTSHTMTMNPHYPTLQYKKQPHQPWAYRCPPMWWMLWVPISCNLSFEFCLPSHLIPACCPPPLSDSNSHRSTPLHSRYRPQSWYCSYAAFP